MKNIDVLCVGATSYDIVFSVTHHPLSDEKTIAESLVSCGGGPAANAAVTVSRMGLTSAFSGYLGQDTFGQLHLEEFKAAGVNTELVVRGKHPTPVSSVLVKPNGERTVVNYRPVGSILSPESVDFSRVNPKTILFDGHEPDLALAILNKAHSKGINTILDAGSLNKGTLQVFEKVDYLVCSKKFAFEITGESDPEMAIDKLSRYNNCVVMTLGKGGLQWKTESRMGYVPAYPIHAIDTTGAGDVFHGVFAGCIASGKQWDHVLRYSSAAAALSCLKLGARPGIPEKNEVDAFFNRFGRKSKNFEE